MEKFSEKKDLEKQGNLKQFSKEQSTLDKFGVKIETKKSTLDKFGVELQA